ncbi:hypothetical protein K0M31_020314 [Melipona bicolor]|uniref:Uncharacterized protein n=1 Tax=Melipona bicolor TaxID=60889 RepID=A0AA40G187_9HYME|nr:hypothetical protein K0M31_020314 [Melipona bicolor]
MEGFNGKSDLKEENKLEKRKKRLVVQDAVSKMMKTGWLRPGRFFSLARFESSQLADATWCRRSWSNKRDFTISSVVSSWSTRTNCRSLSAAALILVNDSTARIWSRVIQTEEWLIFPRSDFLVKSSLLVEKVVWVDPYRASRSSAPCR